MSTVQQTGVLWLSDEFGHTSKQTLVLPPAQTSRFALRSLISKAGLSGSQGGLSFRMTKDVNAVSTALILFDVASGFSANMKMFVNDPSVTLESHDFSHAGKWITRAPMLALENPDPALQLPAQTVLHPQLFLRNTTDRTVQATLAFHWRNAQKDGRALLPTLTLVPQQTRMIDVRKLQEDGTIPADATWSQVTLRTDSLPNEVMAVAASFDDTLRYGVQTPFSDQLAFHMEGGAWQVDPLHDSIIAAGNGTDKAVNARLTFFFAGGTKQYQIERTIAADDQAWIDLGEIIRDGTPDKNGVVLPSNLTTGAYQLLEFGDAPPGSLYEGKVVTDKTYGHATYGCMVCCGYRYASFNLNPISAALDGDTSFYPEGPDACGSSTYENDLYGYAVPSSWGSVNPNIMSVSPGHAKGMSVGSTSASTILANIIMGAPLDSGPGHPCPVQSPQVQGPGQVPPKVNISGSGTLPLAAPNTPGAINTTSLTALGTPSGGTYAWSIVSGNSVSLSTTSGPSVTLTSLSAGISNVEVTYTLNGVPASQIQVETVQQPTSASIYYDSGTTQNVNCAANVGHYPYDGDQRIVSYETLDQSGNDIPNAGMPAAETFSGGSSTCGAFPMPSNGLTLNGGAWSDNFLLCSSACLPANSTGQPTGSCMIQTNHVWSINGFPVFNHTLTVTCTTITPQ